MIADTPHPVLTQPYRLFFFGAAVHATIHLLLWTLLLTGLPAPAVYQPFLWHGYELVFGFAGAVVTGFLLTASANWTGRRTVTPPVLLCLFAAWAGARIAALVSAPSWLLLLFDGIVLWGLVIALGRVLWLTGNRRNYRFIPIVAGLAAATSLFHLASLGLLPDWRYPLLHGAVDLLLILMVIMGGRVIPFFTGRRMPQLRVENPEWLGLGAGGLVLLAVAAHWVGPDHIAAALSWFAACFVLARLLHWSPWGTRHEPMLWILHAGYAWLAIALFLRGGVLAWGWLPWSTALHAVLVGALGCLALGMMARVALGHGGYPIEASRWIVPAFVLVAVAAIPRVLAGSPVGIDQQTGFVLSAGAWILAFGLYALVYARILFSGHPSK